MSSNEILSFLEKFKEVPDRDSNLFGSRSGPEPDPDLNGHENQDRDPNKVGSDP